MMKLADYPWVLKNCFTIHTMFRKLGFPASDIYVEPARNEMGIPTVFVKLVAQGKEFRAIAGPMTMEFEDLERQWISLGQSYNNHEFSDAECDACIQACSQPNSLVDLIIALSNKGITTPLGSTAPSPPANLLMERKKMN